MRAPVGRLGADHVLLCQSFSRSVHATSGEAARQPRTVGRAADGSFIYFLASGAAPPQPVRRTGTVVWHPRIPAPKLLARPPWYFSGRMLLFNYMI